MKRFSSQFTKLVDGAATLRGRIIIASLMLIIILASSYLFIYKYHTYELGDLVTFTFFLQFLSVFILVGVGLPVVFRSGFGFLVVSLGVWFLLVFSTRQLHDNYIDRELGTNGKMLEGKVLSTGAWRSKGELHFYAVFAYRINNKEYQQTVFNQDQLLKVNQVLKIRYSDKHPEISQIVGDYKHKPIIMAY